ncbi:MAG: hypothetical protein FWH18_06510 [Marinilabiliaceae bacterium]|nr:hypothetical protein [Marinilabiliaceae bacterium]
MRKLIKKTSLFCGCIIVSLFANAQEEESKKFKYRGYSGGMMVHTAYLYGGNINVGADDIKIEGVPFGIGGAMRFQFGNHFRIGAEGYSSTLCYGDNSYLSLSWGGLLFDCPYKINNFTFFAGGTIGGGGVKNVTVTNTLVNSMKENALYQKYSIMIADPFIGAEYAFTPRISLTTKIDFVFNLSQKRPDFAMGPRIYLGFSFYHSKINK